MNTNTMKKALACICAAMMMMTAAMAVTASAGFYPTTDICTCTDSDPIQKDQKDYLKSRTMKEKKDKKDQKKEDPTKMYIID